MFSKRTFLIIILACIGCVSLVYSEVAELTVRNLSGIIGNPHSW